MAERRFGWRVGEVGFVYADALSVDTTMRRGFLGSFLGCGTRDLALRIVAGTLHGPPITS